MKSLFAAGAAVAMLTLAFNAPLGQDPAATPIATSSKPLKLADFVSPSAARAECKESENTCVQYEASSTCASSGGTRFRQRTRKIHKDCSQEESFNAWVCSRPAGSDCYG